MLESCAANEQDFHSPFKKLSDMNEDLLFILVYLCPARDLLSLLAGFSEAFFLS